MGKRDKKPYPWEARYELMDELGEGGNGQVFLVKERESGREYALKQLLRRDLAEKAARFANEIRIMQENSAIPGILPVLDASCGEGWYVMPVAQSLLGRIRAENTPMQSVVQGVIALADTLARLHEKGISHRDLKPANLYYYGGRCCLGDFGLVSFPEDSNSFTREDKGLGAIFTIAPEMKRDPKHADGKPADVFSLAKTLWMLLTWEERGFDGVYNPLDRSHGLRYCARFSGVHLVELEELLRDATGNDPLSRPDMGQFRARLAEWLEILEDEDRIQASEWNFINRYLFGDHLPESVTWRDRDSIVEILNTVGTLRAFNHMLFSDCGGLDFAAAEPAAEAGCVCITDTLGTSRIGKPASLHLETFGGDYVWSYFLLELAELEPVFAGDGDRETEFVVEDLPGHYVPARDSVYGVYDYDTGEPLPPGWRAVERYLRGKFLIVLKGSPYNGITSTYDGRHGQCTSGQFRAYMEYLRKMYAFLRDKGAEERQILHLKEFRQNPFAPAEEPRPARAPRKPPGAFVAEHYLTWRFPDLPRPEEGGRLAFFLRFHRKNGGDLAEILEDYAAPSYLCAGGSIKKGPPEGGRYCTGDRAQAVEIRDRCRAQMAQWCREGGFDPPGLDGPYFEIELKKRGKPTHLFTREEIAALLRRADDRVDNLLVIDGDGQAHILQDMNAGQLYPVRHTAWDARGNNVGKYADLSYVDALYLDSLGGWLAYLKSGSPQLASDLPPAGDAPALIAEIRRYY